MIYLVRHGETTWNRDRKLQGLRGGELTSRGRKQAIQVAHRLQDLPPITKVFTSPLQRCWDTLDIISTHLPLNDIPIIPHPKLMERSFGIYEGGQIDTSPYREYWQKELNANSLDWLTSKPKFGESYFHILERVRKLLTNTIFFDSHENVLVLTHSVISKMLRAYIELGLNSGFLSLITADTAKKIRNVPRQYHNEIYLVTERQCKLLHTKELK